MSRRITSLDGPIDRAPPLADLRPPASLLDRDRPLALVPDTGSGWFGPPGASRTGTAGRRRAA